MVMRNGVKFALVAGIGHLLVGIGELLIMVITASLTWFAIYSIDDLRDNLYEPLVPVIVRFRNFL